MARLLPKDLVIRSRAFAGVAGSWAGSRTNLVQR